MSIERMVLAFAGSFILISLILSRLFSPYWFLSPGQNFEGDGSKRQWRDS